MGHYWSEVKPDPTPEVIKNERLAESFRPQVQENFGRVISGRYADLMQCNTCFSVVPGNYMDVEGLIGHLEWHKSI